MSQTVLAVIGISSAVVNTVGLVPYIRDIFKGKTQPERATWWIWLVLNAIVIAALINAGATWGLAMNFGQTIAVLLIAGLSVKYGFGSFHRRDLVSLIFAAIGIVIWRFTSQPIAAILIVVAVDAAGFWLTVNKSWHAPHTETLISWQLAAASGFLGVLAVGELSPTKLIYPLYIALGNSLLVWVIIHRRPVVKA